VPHPEIVAAPGKSRPDRFAPELREFEENERVSVCEVLDRVLNKGVVVAGEVTISVAGVDLLYLGLQLVLTSIETARASLHDGPPASGLCLDIGKRRSHGAGWDDPASRV
jgi:hypothetical protein